jgi:hypothetical protein
MDQRKIENFNLIFLFLINNTQLIVVAINIAFFDVLIQLMTCGFSRITGGFDFSFLYGNSEGTIRHNKL